MVFLNLLDPDENLPTPAKFSHVKSREAQPTATAELSSASTGIIISILIFFVLDLMKFLSLQLFNHTQS